MAPTTRISKKRKRLVVFYMLLMLITLVGLGTIVYLVYDIYSFSNIFAQNYQKLTFERNQKIKYIEENSQEIIEVNKKLSDLEYSNPRLVFIKEKLSLLNENQLLYEQIVDNEAEFIESVESQTWTREESNQLEEDISTFIQKDRESLKLVKENIRTSNKELEVTKFLIADSNSKQCFGAINYNGQNINIANRIDTCIKQLPDFNSFTLDDKLDDTQRYLNSTKSYWTTRKRLYETLDDRDKQNEATKLREQLDQLDEERNDASTDMIVELESWTNQ